jgi:hypothetical protein
VGRLLYAGAMNDGTKAIPTTGAILPDGSLAEMVYDEKERTTRFCLLSGGEIAYEADLTIRGVRYRPYSGENNLLTNGVVLFASEATEYESEDVLLKEIRAFIHRYVDLSPLFEEATAAYVLLSWIYDSFEELPYLRVRGDYGSGKSRFLLIVGSLLYKPLFASGASTVSPIFRILDSFRGSLVLDEADFRLSDERADIVKILNNGNARGFPVLRSEPTPGKEYNPRAYAVFGPKVIATRGDFEDRALESRALTEDMGIRSLRSDIPLNLPPSHREEALGLRNKLLLFRLRSFGRERDVAGHIDRTLQPRIAQLVAPLLSAVESEETREAIRTLAAGRNRDILSDQSADLEGELVEVLAELGGEAKALPVGDVASRFREKMGGDLDRPVTPRYVGYLLRKKLLLHTEKRHGVFVIPEGELKKLPRLRERYGVSSPDDAR